MAVTIDDIVESAASSVLRALDARKAGAKGAAGGTHGTTTESLVSSGFNVEFRIICGGPRWPPWESGGLGQGKTQQ